MPDLKEVQSSISDDGRVQAKVLHDRSYAYLMEFWYWKPSRGEWRPMLTCKQSYETQADAAAAAARFMGDLTAERFDAAAVAAREGDEGWAPAVALCRARLEDAMGRG